MLIEVCAGYHYDLYDEDEEGLKFNPYTSTYDDGYGDLYFDDVEQEVATCRLGEDGQPKFNGDFAKLSTAAAFKSLLLTCNPRLVS